MGGIRKAYWGGVRDFLGGRQRGSKIIEVWYERERKISNIWKEKK